MDQAMAWCHQTQDHYLSQCLPRTTSPYDMTRPQKFKASPYWSSFWLEHFGFIVAALLAFISLSRHLIFPKRNTFKPLILTDVWRVLAFNSYLAAKLFQMNVIFEAFGARSRHITSIYCGVQLLAHEYITWFGNKKKYVINEQCLGNSEIWN